MQTKKLILGKEKKRNNLKINPDISSLPLKGCKLEISGFITTSIIN